ncbi:hypothetical protein BKA65DRAFT_71369 [Rhexocercosporidium sp. MPI-PUGE-AT-0058]|nr:hypothetical protein BKA65DRAFT_71369 [Rhexocercosporidium sp. MPI-PUGE-AT-0058]
MSSSPEVFHPPPHSDLEVSAPGQHQVTVADKFYSDQPQEAVPPQYYHGSPEGDRRKERTICGFRAATFFLSLALVLVILAAAIGGGVGGTMAVNNAKSANSNSNGAAFTSTVISTYTTTATPVSGASASGTATKTSTSASILSVPTSGTLALDCPNIDNTELRMTLIETSVFTVVCGRDYPGAKNDIIAVTVYSLADCARACASYNRNSGSEICKGAAFKTDLLANVQVNFGNCWLKNNTNTPSSGSSNTLAALVLNS